MLCLIFFVIFRRAIAEILEFNAETPAGIVESIGLNKIIKEEQGISELNTNIQLTSKLEETFKKIMNDFEKEKPIKHIAFLTCNYYEDLFTTYALADIAKKLKGYKVSVGNINKK
ncbi:MAG: glutathionylspermidine synthase family protein [Cellulosilyticaceae bacterium]